MARVGRNPTKLISGAPVRIDAPPTLSVGLLTDVPSLAEELEVVRLALVSARARAGRPVHVGVVDNGSCASMRRGLVALLVEGLVDQLVLAERVADPDAVIARAVMAMPGPEVVCADGDLCFLPDWLAPMSSALGEDADATVVDAAPSSRSVHLLCSAGARARLQAPEPPRVADLPRVPLAQATTRPLGTRLTPPDLAELDGLTSRATAPQGGATGSWVWRRPVVQRAARRVHDFSFRVLYETGSGPGQ